jgi:hypothetical protein
MQTPRHGCSGCKGHASTADHRWGLTLYGVKPRLPLIPQLPGVLATHPWFAGGGKTQYYQRPKAHVI